MNIINIQNKEYPALLKKIGKDAPRQLFCKGSRDSAIFENCLAVVGSRQMTTYGKRVVEQIVTEIASAGVTVVSGFMYGVDAAAHKAALQAGGRTIAVMPCGIDLIHPEYQQDLYAEILNHNGLVVSEYEGDMQPSNWTYPRRNRIVAGLSKAVLVVEAGLKSGSLITANFAKKFGRKIFSVPGPITSETSKGTLQLIKEGAEIAANAQDILNFFKIKMFALTPISLEASTDRLEFSGLEKKILNQLKGESLEIDVLGRNLGMPTSKIGTIVSLMELKGIIKQDGGKYRL